MFSSAVFDVAFGLVVTFLALSLICTVVNELIATALSLRAKSLQSAMTALVDDPAIRSAFYRHCLTNMAGSSSGAGHPSYISGKTFALALLGSLDPAKPMPVFGDLQELIGKLPQSKIRDTLRIYVATADNDMTTLRNGLAEWFDQAMDRLSGKYKRNLKLISWIVGLLIAVSLNVNTFRIADALWHDPALRDEIVASGTRAIDAGAATKTEDIAAAMQQLNTNEALLRPLPMGWDARQLSSLAALRSLETSEGMLRLLTLLVGWLVTAAALSLGAPFWFDVLSKFINIRGAGNKPLRTPPSSA